MKIAIVTLILLLAGFLSFFLTRPRCEWNANEVYNAFEAGHLPQAFERLSACETTLCVGRARLSRVYLLQADGKVEEAAKELCSAKSWVERKGGPNIAKETALATALQHLLEGDGELAAAELKGEESLLRGIAAFYCGDWALSATLLQKPPDPDRRWLRTVIAQCFPPSWCLEARAVSLIELGHYLQARELIGTPHHPLFGKSLLKEAALLPADQALALYRQVSEVSTRGLQRELIEAALLRYQEEEVVAILSRCLDSEGQLQLARQLIDRIPLHPNNLKNWDLERVKAPGFDDLNQHNITNIEQVEIVEPRELSRSSKTNSSG
ncbi:MAG: hypothetical protein JSR80_04825, partial [Verrucomicrobia bacterium]|nr:hypothetical protein [Verrucomicrobiota bacterium]